ncbi:MAG: hypothetical protein KDJ54_15135 [Candidatus Competibacteraceae bacterium]|nr:hypothetical protein [Candidatus Competibacteraceae bacterium]
MNARNLMKMLATALVVGLMASPMALAAGPGGGNGGGGGGNRPPTGETTGNNLSFPVIWAEGVTKVLRGTPGEVETEGAYWYQWGTNGTDPDVVPASCPSDPDEDPDEEPGKGFCDDGVVGTLTIPAGVPVANNPLPLVRAYLQKDPLNTWQAGSANGSTTSVDVDWIDWGDNLESVDWYTRSQVRTEVVLFKDLTEPMTEYEMRHVFGWGINEVHGLAVSLDGEVQEGPGTQATVYSPCARLTIQKLLVAREILPDDALDWVPQQGWTERYSGTEYINEPIFNKAVYAGGDGPGYYSAEINVKGRIIYGYTWNVRQLHDLTGVPPTAAGDYRITFSLDDTCGTVDLNTSLAMAEILVPTEEEIALAAEEEEDGSDTGGATAVLDKDLNLTYIDVRILERGGGGGNAGGNNAGGNDKGNGPKK